MSYIKREREWKAKSCIKSDPADNRFWRSINTSFVEIAGGWGRGGGNPPGIHVWVCVWVWCKLCCHTRVAASVCHLCVGARARFRANNSKNRFVTKFLPTCAWAKDEHGGSGGGGRDAVALSPSLCKPSCQDRVDVAAGAWRGGGDNTKLRREDIRAKVPLYMWSGKSPKARTLYIGFDNKPHTGYINSMRH